MRIATWNVNSIRARAERVGAFLDRSDVDVLAIQELKAKDSQFPREVFDSRGYEVAFHGLNQWNGVAIASRVGLADARIGFEGMPGWGEDDAAEARAISALCAGVRVHSLYVPNGRELDHPHYAYKLAWLDRLREAVAAELAADAAARLVLCGDFNVAPRDEDVWDMAEFEGATHVSQPERDAFQALLDAGLAEVTRAHTPGAYTFWDYQQLRFPKKQGMRIDFQLASRALAERVADARIDREERKGKGASDHAPVIVDYAD
ncbi:exodeoxyribonuclease III [Brevibacterium sp. 5221]|uniref:Exodeoxyribonuclease III n=1 Tax=Brevibacterium rongguiense TaxID=2695267 RepID=A0A6N9H4A1_9MICO|nr:MULTISPECIES: exodeoxyribonuclease III [Brevibacterium]MYM18765.1 exodeoxyribonuclease III [Brevibacterium rongguiense]WAL39838.1 exodeoxyribonuclease III [Brevibacterium sp. BRM-1]